MSKLSRRRGILEALSEDVAESKGRLDCMPSTRARLPARFGHQRDADDRNPQRRDGQHQAGYVRSPWR